MTQFKKGQVPFNKGLKLEDYLPTEIIKKIEKTQFKKGENTGENNHTWKGGIQTNKRDGTFIRTGANQRVRLARQVHESENGKIPAGWVVYHVDGDKDNEDPDNLLAVPRAVLVKLNAKRIDSTYWGIIKAIEDYLTAKTLDI